MENYKKLKKIVKLGIISIQTVTIKDSPKNVTTILYILLKPV